MWDCPLIRRRLLLIPSHHVTDCTTSNIISLHSSLSIILLQISLSHSPCMCVCVSVLSLVHWLSACWSWRLQVLYCNRMYACIYTVYIYLHVYLCVHDDVMGRWYMGLGWWPPSSDRTGTDRTDCHVTNPLKLTILFPNKIWNSLYKKKVKDVFLYI